MLNMPVSHREEVIVGQIFIISLCGIYNFITKGDRNGLSCFLVTPDRIRSSSLDLNSIFICIALFLYAQNPK